MYINDLIQGTNASPSHFSISFLQPFRIQPDGLSLGFSLAKVLRSQCNFEWLTVQMFVNLNLHRMMSLNSCVIVFKDKTASASSIQSSTADSLSTWYRRYKASEIKLHQSYKRLWCISIQSTKHIANKQLKAKTRVQQTLAEAKQMTNWCFQAHWL